MTNFKQIAVVILFALGASSSHSQEVREPEAATGFIDKKTVTGSEYMVVAANSYASEVGGRILAKGGSAVDAAIAIQMVLTLVEPQSSGIGGGAFLLHWDNKHKALVSYDGRETAPAQVTPSLFLDQKGKPVSWMDAVVGGRSVGVPGVLAALKKAHLQHGKLPWSDLFTDAINLAEQGFIVSPRLEKLLQANFNPGLKKLSTIKDYFYPQGKAIQAGQRLKNKPLAKVYKSIATEGPSVFYQGWIAKKIVAGVNNSPIAPGVLSLSDMKNYQANEHPAVCAAYNDYNVCGMAPPSSGGVAVIQTLKMLAPFNLSQYQPNSLESVHLFTQSSRLAFADRNRYIADPAFITVPSNALLENHYLAKRAQLISLEKDMGKASAGELAIALSRADDKAYELPSTSHFSIVDSQGNAVSMTSSIEMGFGSALMVEGFILNNQLTDFSFIPEHNGKTIANSVAAGKRPRSSMAPMMVFNPDGSLRLIVGSPGGSRIINYVTQSIIAVLDWQLSPQAAVNLPHVTNRNNVTTLEKDTELVSLAAQLTAKGHKVVIKDLNSGLHMIELQAGKLIGGADPRREGLVVAK
ncbi:MAG: gamma-glutamyltransferase [Thalassotalea sp.]